MIKVKQVVVIKKINETNKGNNDKVKSKVIIIIIIE